MKAFVITGPHEAGVYEVDPPQAGPGEVVVDVQRAGVCGTDVEFFTGEMQYLGTGLASYPVRIGHEWMGTVSAIGAGVDPTWTGRRVTGDTMLSCGVCERCLAGRGNVCAFRSELGVSRGRAGALAEQVAVPARALHVLPDAVDDAAGALVEPGGNALRSVRAAHLDPGERCLIFGAGTIGLLCAMFARAAGAEVHLVGRSPRSIEFAREFEFAGTWSAADVPDLAWHAVIDASNDEAIPARAVELVEPGRHVVYVGLAGSPSLVDTREVALKDVTAVGILGASDGLAGTIAAYATGAVDPRPLVAATVPLEGVAGVLAGRRPVDAGPGPKFAVSIGDVADAHRGARP